MNFRAISNAVTSRAGRQLLVVQKHSPGLLFAAGVVGVVASAVLASRATLHLEDALIEVQDDLRQAKDLRDEHPDKYSEQDFQSDRVKLWVRGAVRVSKLYGPAIVVGAVSIVALTGSHVILSRRNVALTAAYAALDKGFREYRKRVVDELGEESDKKFRYGESINTELAEDSELGFRQQKVKVLGDKKSSIYARFFDESSTSFSKSPMHNQLFIQCQQNYANDRLRSRGHLFLNEVYDMLGLERSPEGAVVGWLRDSDKKGEGDGFVDFGVFEGDAYMGQEFVNGSERSVLLDFNVDGVIWDKI